MVLVEVVKVEKLEVAYGFEVVVCFKVEADADAEEVVELTPVLRTVALNLLKGDCGESGINEIALATFGGVGDQLSEISSSSPLSLSLPLSLTLL